MKSTKSHMIPESRKAHLTGSSTHSKPDDKCRCCQSFLPPEAEEGWLFPQRVLSCFNEQDAHINKWAIKYRCIAKSGETRWEWPFSKIEAQESWWELSLRNITAFHVWDAGLQLMITISKRLLPSVYLLFIFVSRRKEIPQSRLPPAQSGGKVVDAIETLSA